MTDKLAAFRRRVDRAAGALAERHADRLRCGLGCADCCRDGLSVFEIEAAAIRAGCGEALRGAAPHPAGACAFLGPDRACRIYPQRPYVCRTQGLPLRWLDHEARVEHRDICPLNDAGPPLETLPRDACFELGPREAELQQLEVEDARGAPRRVALRDLFLELARED
jgi:hypothetical protein